MSKLICLAGMPGSGKTTWAQKFMKMNPDFLYVSPDAYYERIMSALMAMTVIEVILLKFGWQCLEIFIQLKQMGAMY